MKKLPIGIQTFQKIREDDYVYVDKTGIAVDLINRYQYVFLSRPRRFGKSLFLDTLHNIFEGKKKLFAGLASDKTHDWSKTYPVIKISFGRGNFRSPETLQVAILEELRDNENRLGVNCDIPVVSTRFSRIIKSVHEKYKQPVVILIDEYDKPILDNIDQPEMAALAREELKAFYSAIKENDAYIRFAFLTGVTKFSRVSVFSGINNIEDISLAPEFATVCGYTQHDLETVFAKHLEGADMDEVRRWYNGYNFLGENVYNPFDILLFLRGNKQFESYWFETATPTFLIKLLKQRQFFLPDLNNIKTGKELLSSFDIDAISPVTLLFQSGYLTIREVRRRGTFVSYILGFPNLEVSAAFTNSLLELFTETFHRNDIQGNLYFSLEDNDMEGFKAAMSVEMADTIYLIEFKVDMPQQKALEQIKDRGYAEKYQAKGKKIVLIGIGFSSEEKNVTEFIWEEG